MGQVIDTIISKTDDTLLIDVYTYTKGIYIAVVIQDSKRTSIKFVKN